GKLHVSCRGDVLSQIPTRSDWNEFIARAVKYQGGRLNGRQHMAHIDFVVRLHQVSYGAWTRCCALDPGKPFHEGQVIAAAWSIHGYQNAFTPMRSHSANSFCERFGSHAPRLVLDRCTGPIKYQRGGSLRIGSSKHQAHRAAFGPAIDCGA